MTTGALRIASLEQLATVAAAAVRALPSRGFVALEGDLGAGKTAFVQAVAVAAGLPEGEVVSPTFGLIHVHPLPERLADGGLARHADGGLARHAAGRLVHADMYRLVDVGDLHETGWDDATTGPGWVFVEWPQRIAAALPADRLDITIEVESPTERRMTLVSRGPRHDAVVASMLSACDSTPPPRSSP